MIATARAFLGLLYAACAILSIGTACPAPYATPGRFLTNFQALRTEQWTPGWREGDVLVADVISSSQLQLAGTYVGRAPANDAAKRTYSLILTLDGSALWNTFYLGKAHATLTGHWQQTGSELVLSFDALGSGLPPRPITFHYHHSELQPVHWDQSEWGRVGPPVLHRTRDRSGAVNS